MTGFLVLVALVAAACFLLANVVPLVQIAERRRLHQAYRRPLAPITWGPLVVLVVCVFLAVISL